VLDWVDKARALASFTLLRGKLGRTYKASDPDLRAGVAELCERSVEQAVLLLERLDVGVGVRLRGLECHICIGDFWYRGARRTDEHSY
jgi:hypothetical protein